MEEYVNNEDDDEKEITSDNEDAVVIHRDIKVWKRHYLV